LHDLLARHQKYFVATRIRSLPQLGGLLVTGGCNLSWHFAFWPETPPPADDVLRVEPDEGLRRVVDAAEDIVVRSKKGIKLTALRRKLRAMGFAVPSDLHWRLRARGLSHTSRVKPDGLPFRIRTYLTSAATGVRCVPATVDVVT
jgi:hypothetical protein